jgi:hypothetical protein
MSGSRRSLTVVRAWLKDIGVQIALRTGDKHAVKRMPSIAVYIAGNLPDAAFCPESAGFVLQRTTGEPQASAIREAVQEWWGQHAPTDPSAIPPDIAASSLDLTDQMWCRLFRQSGKADEAAVLGVIRAQSASAFGWLYGNDPAAFSIAKHRGWAPHTMERLEREWADPNTVERAIEACYGRYMDGTEVKVEPIEIERGLALLTAIIQKWAPHNLHMLPVTGTKPQRAHDEPAQVSYVLPW